MGNKYKQYEDNVKICRDALRRAKTDSERSAAEYNLRSAEEQLENVKKADKSSSKKNKKKNSEKKRRSGCLWTILKICTLGLLFGGGNKDKKRRR